MQPLLTGADVLLRLAADWACASIWLTPWAARGWGCAQLHLAIYAPLVTLATAGVSVAATRLMAEELARGRAQARGMLVRLAGTGLLGAAAMAAQYGLAGAAARWWLGDVRAAGSLRGVGLRDALDGPLGCAAGVLYRPAAGGAQRAEPAGGAERRHRSHLAAGRWNAGMSTRCRR